MPRTFISPEDQQKMMERAVRAWRDTDVSFKDLCRRFVPFIQRKDLEARLRAEGLYPRLETVTLSNMRHRCRTPERWIHTGHEREPREAGELDLQMLQAIAEGVDTPTELGQRLTSKRGKARGRWASKHLARLRNQQLVGRVAHGKYVVSARGRQLLDK